MADPIYIKSPFADIIDPKPLPGAQQVKEAAPLPDLTADPVPAQAGTPAPAAAAPSTDNLLPPDQLRPLFEATAAHFQVPVNVLMAIAHQESRYNPDATNADTGAAGMTQYLGATAKSLGINPRDPNEAIPAAAQQIRERLDKGMSMEDAVKEHFAGPDRKKWGEKTAAYGAEVLAKAGAIGKELYGDAAEDGAAPAPSAPAAPDLGPEQNKFAPTRMRRADYEKEFRAMNPRAGQGAVDAVMAQYDQQVQDAGATRAKTRTIGPKPVPTPEQFFDARLNERLQGPQNGVVPQLPGNQQPAAFPETGTRHDPSTFDTVAGNLIGGALNTLIGAVAGSARLLGADDVADEWETGKKQVQGRQKELGGDTMKGKVAGLIGGILPAMANASESMVLQFATNSGLFGVPAFQDTYKAKLAEGQSPKLAAIHAFESFGMNTVGPMIMPRGVGALVGKLGGAEAAGLKGAALGLGQAAGEGVAFSGVSTAMDKGTDVLAGQKNDRSWIDPEDMAVQALGFGAMRAGHMVPHAVDAAMDKVAPGYQVGRALQEDAGNLHFDPASAQGIAADRLSAQNYDPRTIAPQDTARAPGDVGPSPMTRMAPAAPAGPLTAAIEAAAPRPAFQASDEGFTGQILGDDGQVHTIDSRTGVTMTEPPAAPAGPLEAAIKDAAEQHAINPAPLPEVPQEAPQPPALETLPLEDLRAQLKQVAAAAKANPSNALELRTQRAAIEKEIGARAKQAKADSKPAEEPLKSGPFEDMAAANRMMLRYAEQTGTPHEVVGSEGKFTVRAIGGQGDGIHPAGAARGTDGHGRSGEPASGVGSDLNAGRAGTGDGTGARASIEQPAPAKERAGDAAGDRVAADGAADAQPALTEAAPYHKINPFHAYAFPDEARANAFMDKKSVDRAQFEAVQTGPVRWQVKPRAAPVQESFAQEVTADVPESPQVPEEAQAARSAEAAQPIDATAAAGAEAGTGAAPAKPKRQPSQRELTNAKQEEAVKAAADNLAARKVTGGDRARERVQKENPFLAFVAEHGIHIDDRSDTGGQGGRAGMVLVPGFGSVYRKAGARLDELAGLAHEAGFLTDQDMQNPSDNGGTRKLAEMIQRAVHNKEVIGKAQSPEAALPDADHQLMAEAHKLGIDVTGKSADQVYDDVLAAHAAEYTHGESDIVALALHDAAIPLDGGKSFDNLTEEQIDEIFGIRTAGEAQGRGRQDQAGAAGAARGADEGTGQAGQGEDLLSSYTPAELRAREEAADAVAKAKETDAAKADAAAKKERDDKDVRARQAASADEFQLGQDAHDSLAGQKDIFGQDEGVRYSVSGEHSPTFYSALERALPEMAKVAGKDGTIKPEQARAWLAARQKEGKFKAEELQWVGVDDWLQAQPGRVSVADIQNFVRNNGVQVQEVEKGAPHDLRSMSEAELRAYAEEREGPDYLGDFDFNNEADREALIEDLGFGPKAEVRYGNYVLPGGENYRELLLTLPTEAPNRTRKLREQIVAIQERGMDEARDLTPDEVAQMKALREQLAQAASRTPAGAYSSTHWDEKNIVAHVRFNDRVDADGKRVLFIEELQSDWGQDGLKKGFREQQERQLDELIARRDSLTDEAERSQVQAEINALGRKAPGVAEGPFVGDTKAWLSLGIKRMIRYAAENGYDRVAFVNGEQSADRYDLSKQVSRIEYSKNPGDDTFSFIVHGLDGAGSLVSRERASVDEVANTVGKEIAEKMVANEGQDLGFRGKYERSISGSGLKVGGEGMKAFYDHIVPQTINEVLKKVGGGRASAIDISSRSTEPADLYEYVGKEYSLDELRHALAVSRKSGGNIYENPLTGRREHFAFNRTVNTGDLKKLISLIEAGSSFSRAMLHPDLSSSGFIDLMGGQIKERPAASVPHSTNTQVGFDITPELRAKALAGMPLFSVAHPMAKDAAREISPLVQSLADKGAIILHQDASTLPVKGKAPSGTQALTTSDGTIHVVANALGDNARGIILHEAFHAGTKALIGSAAWDGLNTRLGALYRQGEKSSGAAREFWDAARARVETAKAKGAVSPGMEHEEFGAYAIEEYAKAPLTVRKWVDDLLGAVKAWALRRFGKQLGNVTPAQLSSLAKLALLDAQAARSASPDLAPAFSDNGENVHSVAGAPQPRVLTPDEQGLLRRVQAGVQDGTNRVKQVQDRIKDLTGVTDLAGADYYGAETNRPGRIAARKEDGRDTLIEPMMRRLAKAGYTQEQLSELLHAQHAEERNEAVAKINPEFPDGGSGMKTKEAEQIIARYQNEPKLLALADEARQIARETLDMKRAYGLITDAQHEALSISYANYVPLKGDGEYGPKVKRAMGHGEREEHVVENIARDFEQAIVVGEKNLARQSLLQMVLQYPDDGLWTARVPPKGRYVAGTVFEISPVGTRNVEASFTSQSQVAAWLEGKGAAAAGYEVNTSGGERVTEFTKPLQDNEVMVYVKGSPVRVQVQDEVLARQLRPLHTEMMNTVLGLMQKHNRYLSTIYTGYNPAFILKNATRDAITGSINMTGNHGALTAAKAWTKYPAAWATMLKWAVTKEIPTGKMGDHLREYRAQGGKIGASYMSDLEEQGKTLQRMFDDAKGASGYVAEGKVGKAAWIAARKAIGGMAHAVEVLNQAFENSLRLALFAQLREQGTKPGQAAQAAKTVTVNFDRKGTATPYLGAFYLFVNPAIQGTANVASTLAHGEHKGQAWALAGMMAAAGFAAAVHGMDDDKDRWLGEKWDTRTKNLRIRIGSHTINVPMSQEYAPFYAVGVAMGEVRRGQSSLRASANVLSSFLDAYYPMQGAIQPGSDNYGMDLLLAHVPTVGKMAAQIAANRNSFGNKVVPETDTTKNRADNLKMYRGTKNSAYDSAAQGIAAAGQALGADKYGNDLSKVSPETLKLVWATYTGGLGKFVADSAGLGAMVAQGADQIEVGDMPVVKDFVKADKVVPIRSRYFDLAHDAQDAIDQFAQAKKMHDAPEMKAIATDPEKGPVLGLAKMVTAVNKIEGVYADMAVNINADKTLGPADKRARLKALEDKQEAIYRKAITAFKK